MRFIFFYWDTISPFSNWASLLFLLCFKKKEEKEEEKEKEKPMFLITVIFLMKLIMPVLPLVKS